MLEVATATQVKTVVTQIRYCFSIQYVFAFLGISLNTEGFPGLPVAPGPARLRSLLYSTHLLRIERSAK